MTQLAPRVGWLAWFVAAVVGFWPLKDGETLVSGGGIEFERGEAKLWNVGAIAQDKLELSYLRAEQEKLVPECAFVSRRQRGGWSIESVAERGDSQLTVTARYDEQDRLLEAAATLTNRDAITTTATTTTTTATVDVAGGSATIRREGRQPQEFPVPPGVIVTSAPDWTDVLLLCRRYDRRHGGRQSFAGLWIHPIEPAQLVTLGIESTGEDSIEHEGERLQVDRFTIHLRGESSYAAWADSKGTLIRLIPLPFQERTGLFLEGYEESAAGLLPQER